MIRTNLTRANLSGASLRGANLDGALLKGADLRGADFTGAKNLTIDQLADALIDETTILPDYIDRAALMRRTGPGAED